MGIVYPGTNKLMGTSMSSIFNDNTAVLTAGSIHSAKLAVSTQRRSSETIFSANIEVIKVANGYIVRTSTKDGYEGTAHIASTIQEVNDLIAASVVAYRLENA